MTLPANWDEAVERLARIGPFAAMCEDEAAAGWTLVKPGEVSWLSAADWHDDVVVSVKNNEVRIVAIKAREIGKGAFRRLIDAICEAGLKPIVVEPLPLMEAILKRWGWHSRIEGKGFNRQDLWRPRKTP